MSPLEKDRELLRQANTPRPFDENWEEILKKKLFEEEMKKKEDEEDSPYYEEERSAFVHKHREGKWDVPIDETIEYFDPELSYELTGYRPITMTEGLDFDPTPFCEAGETFDRTGRYTDAVKGTKSYVEFWNEQKKRCVEGYTVGKYHVTGDHYFFLNFYRMQTPKIALKGEKKVLGRGQSFPRFLSKQYEFFHYVSMCEYLGKDIVMLKARGLGFSEMLACLAVRPFITTRKFRTVCTAAADAQLDPLLDKCWTQLN